MTFILKSMAAGFAFGLSAALGFVSGTYFLLTMLRVG